MILALALNFIVKLLEQVLMPWREAEAQREIAI